MAHLDIPWNSPVQPSFDTRLSAATLQATYRRRMLLAGLFVLGLSLVLAWLVVKLEILAAIVFVVVLGILAVAARARVGLYVTILLTLMFEPLSADPLMMPGQYIDTSLQTTLRIPVTFSPLEMLLMVTFVFWLLNSILNRELAVRGGKLLLPIVLFAGALIWGLVHGAMTGGDMNIGMWEARSLFYAIMAYFLAANTIRTPAHLRALITVILLGGGFYAIEGIYRKLALINTNAIVFSQDDTYGHDSAVFLGVLVLLVIAQQVIGGPRWQRVLGPFLMAASGYTLLAAERRASYIAVIICFLAFGLVFLVAYRKAFYILVLPLIIAGAVYLPVFWNNNSMLGQPARAVRSISSPDARDAASNLYRDLEKINVRAGMEMDPLLGLGFGKQFPFVVQLPSLDWWLFWHYEPHANILWVWLKTGAIGFVLFWYLMGSAITRAARLAKDLRYREGQLFALLALAGVMSMLVFSYVDLGLVSGRLTVFLGMLLGVLAVLDQIGDSSGESAQGIQTTT